MFYALPADVQRGQLRLEQETQKPRKLYLGMNLQGYRDHRLQTGREISREVTHIRSRGSNDTKSSANFKLVELGDIQAYVKRWTSNSHATSSVQSGHRRLEGVARQIYGPRGVGDRYGKYCSRFDGGESCFETFGVNKCGQRD
jgi:hypothetical protein